MTSDFDGLWHCDVCSNKHFYNPRLRCNQCDFDLCSKCAGTTEGALDMRMDTWSLSRAVEKFRPADFLEIKDKEVREEKMYLYCAARLWTTSGLIHKKSEKDIADWLSLSEFESEEYEKHFRILTKPWVTDDKWHEQMLKFMQKKGNECLSCFFFTICLEYIRERHRNDMSGIELIEDELKQWQPTFHHQMYTPRVLLHQQLLLKEVGIGRRSEELPSWSGYSGSVTYLELLVLSQCIHKS
jgi:hypothetical protein